MLREYQGFITPTRGVSLVYLRIEECLLAHLFLSLAAWTVGLKRKTSVIFYKCKIWNPIIRRKKNPTNQKTKPKPENTNLSGIQLNLLYTGLVVAASSEGGARGAAVHT